MCHLSSPTTNDFTSKISKIKLLIENADIEKAEKKYADAFSNYLIAAYNANKVEGIESLKWKTICYLKICFLLEDDNKNNSQYLEFARKQLKELHLQCQIQKIEDPHLFYCLGTLYFNYYKLSAKTDLLKMALKSFTNSLELFKKTYQKKPPFAIYFALGICEIILFQIEYLFESGHQNREGATRALQWFEKAFQENPHSEEIIHYLGWTNCLVAMTSVNSRKFLDNAIECLDQLPRERSHVVELLGILRYRKAFADGILYLEQAILAFVDLESIILSQKTPSGETLLALCNIALQISFFTNLTFYLEKATRYMKIAKECANSSVIYRLNLLNYKIHHALLKNDKNLISSTLKDFPSEDLKKEYAGERIYDFVKKYELMTVQILPFLNEEGVCKISEIYNRLCNMYNSMMMAKQLCKKWIYSIPIADNISI